MKRHEFKQMVRDNAEHLLSEHGENPEYDRAIIELAADLGVVINDRSPTMSWSRRAQCWVWDDGRVVQGAVLRPEQLLQPSTEAQVEGCSCGMADKGAPGHDHDDEPDEYQWEPTVTIDVPNNPDHQGSVYRMRSHGQASGTEDQAVLLWETGNVYLPLANLIDDAFGDNEHPADCLYCASGEGMAHTYEPPTEH